MAPIPGSKDITVSVVRCDNGNPIIMFSVYDARDTLQAVYNTGTNIFIIYSAIPGMKFKVAAQYHQAKWHTLTQAELNAQFVEVCLDDWVEEETPEPKPKPGICALSCVVYPDGVPRGAAALQPYYAFRHAISLTPTGGLITRRYHETSDVVLKAIRSDLSLALEFAALLLRVQPHINAIMQPRPLGNTCCADPCGQPRFDAELVGDVVTFVERVNAATDGALQSDLSLLLSNRERLIGLALSDVLMLPLDLASSDEPPEQAR